MAKNVSVGVGVSALPGSAAVFKSIMAQMKQVQSQATSGVRQTVEAIRGVYAKAPTIKGAAEPAGGGAASAAMDELVSKSRMTSGALVESMARIAQEIEALVNANIDASMSLETLDAKIASLPPELQAYIQMLKAASLEMANANAATMAYEGAMEATRQALGMTKAEVSKLAAADKAASKAQVTEEALRQAAAQQAVVDAMRSTVGPATDVAKILALLNQQFDSIANTEAQTRSGTVDATTAFKGLHQGMVNVNDLLNRLGQTSVAGTNEFSRLAAAVGRVDTAVGANNPRLQSLIGTMLGAGRATTVLAKSLGEVASVSTKTGAATQTAAQKIGLVDTVTRLFNTSLKDHIRNLFTKSKATQQAAAEEKKSIATKRQSGKEEEKQTQSIRGTIRALFDKSTATAAAAKDTKMSNRMMRTTVSHSYSTVKAIDVLGSSFQGIQLGASLLTGNLMGLGMSIFFLRMSFIPLVVAFAAATMAIMVIVKVITLFANGLKEAGVAAQNTLLKFRAITDSVQKGTEAWVASTQWAVRYGQSMEAMRGSMVELWQQGLLNENMMEASIALSSAWGMSLNEAASALSTAVGETERNVESLRKYGLVIEGVTTNMDRMEAAAAIATATMDRFGSSIDARLHTVAGASQRASSAMAMFWEIFTEPIATNVIAPIINGIANMAASMGQLIAGLWTSGKAQKYFQATLDKARQTIAKYRPEIQMLGNIVRMIVVTAFWMLQMALRAVVNAMETFLAWVRHITMANTALGRAIKPLVDMLRQLAKSFKDLTFANILQAFKDFWANFMTLLGEFGVSLTNFFAALLAAWKKHAATFITNALLALFLASLWKLALGKVAISPLKAMLATFIFDLLGRTFIESLPVEEIVKDILNRVFDWMVWGAIIGGIIGGGPWGAMVGGIAGLILGILDEKLGWGVGDIIRNFFEKIRVALGGQPTIETPFGLPIQGPPAPDIFDPIRIAWNKFWTWVNTTLWPQLGLIATSFSEWVTNNKSFGEMAADIRAALGDLTEGTTGMGTAIADYGPSILAFWATFWVTMKVGISLTTALALLKVTLAGLGLSIWAVLTPLILLAAIIAGLVVIALRWDKVKENWDMLYFIIEYYSIKIHVAITEWLRNIVQLFLDWVGELKNTWDTLKLIILYYLLQASNAINDWGERMRQKWIEIWDKIVKWFTDWKDAAVVSILTFFLDIIDFFTGDSWDDDMLAAWEDLWEGIVEWFTTWKDSAVDSVITFFTGIWDGIVTWKDDVLETWGDAWDAVLTYVDGIWNDPEGIIQTVLTAVTGVYDDVVEWTADIVTDWEEKWESMKTFLSGIWNDPEGIIQTTLTAVGQVYDDVVTTINSILDNINLTGFYNMGKDIVDQIIKGLEALWDRLTSKLADLANLLNFELPSWMGGGGGTPPKPATPLKKKKKELDESVWLPPSMGIPIPASAMAYSGSSTNITVNVYGNTFSGADEGKMADNLVSELMTQLHLRGVDTTRRF